MMSRQLLLLAVLGAASASLLGCGNGDTGSPSRGGYKQPQSPDSPGTVTGTGPGDAGQPTPVADPTVDAGAVPADDAGPQGCNSEDATAVAQVQLTNSSQTMPLGAGGSFLDGYYTLTNVTQYGGGQQHTYQGQMRVEGCTVGIDMIVDGVDNKFSVEMTYNGTLITFAEICGATTLHNFQYTADPSEAAFTLYSQDTNLSFTYTQPTTM